MKLGQRVKRSARMDNVPTEFPRPSDPDRYESPAYLIERRIRGVTEWLKENAPDCVEEQAHLNAGSRERIYWHYGYIVALKDVQKLLTRPQPTKN